VAKGRIAAVARICIVRIHYNGRPCLTQKCSFLWRNLDLCLITKFLEPCESVPKQRKHWQHIISDHLYESTVARHSILQRHYSQICSALGHVILLSFFAILVPEVEWVSGLIAYSTSECDCYVDVNPYELLWFVLVYELLYLFAWLFVC